MAARKTLEEFDSDKEEELRLKKDTDKQFVDWLRFYEEVFGLSMEEATEIVIPKRKPGFNWLVVVPRHVDLRGVLQACREKFEVNSCFTDPSAEIGWDSRSNKKAGYAIWVRHRHITDLDMLGISAEELENKAVPTITLLERLLMELMWFGKQGKHLDSSWTTLCSGTMYARGTVPTVAWMCADEYLRIGWIGFTGSKSYIGAREVVEANV